MMAFNKIFKPAYNNRFWIVLTLIVVAQIYFHSLRPLGTILVDSGRWQFELSEASRNKIPYLNLTWQYPPLSFYLGGLWGKVFGTSLLSWQLFISALGFSVAIVSALIMRLFAMKDGAILGSIFFSLGIATWMGQFDLFSSSYYSPAPLLGGLGCSIEIASLGYWVKMKKKRFLLFGGTGLAIALLSKPEIGLGCLLATVMICAVLFYKDPKNVWHVFGCVLFLGLTLSVLGYIWVGLYSGFDLMYEGILGYGLAQKGAGISIPLLTESFLKSIPIMPLAIAPAVFFVRGSSKKNDLLVTILASFCLGMIFFICFNLFDLWRGVVFWFGPTCALAYIFAYLFRLNRDSQFVALGDSQVELQLFVMASVTFCISLRTFNAGFQSMAYLPIGGLFVMAFYYYLWSGGAKFVCHSGGSLHHHCDDPLHLHGFTLIALLMAVVSQFASVIVAKKDRAIFIQTAHGKLPVLSESAEIYTNLIQF